MEVLKGMCATLDSIIPDESRLALYYATRYLQELEIALRLEGVHTHYDRPGCGGITVPRLRIRLANADWSDWVVGVSPKVLETQTLEWNEAEPEWWFMWCKARLRKPICQAVDMPHAARLIVLELQADSL
jgi:hypothetical protein